MNNEIDPGIKIEIDWALNQLQALELIKFSKDGEKFYLTDKGREQAIQLLQKIPWTDKILIALQSLDSIKAVIEDEG